MTEQTTHFAGDLDTDLEVWELTLPEDEAGCETTFLECPKAATWRVRRDYCNCSSIVCDDHKNRWVATHAARAGLLGLCYHCGAQGIFGNPLCYPI